MQTKFNIAIVGATGNVGGRMLQILEERSFPVNNIYVIASNKSKGKKISFIKNKNTENQKIIIEVEDIDLFDFSKAQIALVSAGSCIVKQYYKKITSTGCIIIDNSSAFRQDKSVPLIIPEVNLQDMYLYKKKLIIANPNCSTSQAVLPLKVIDVLFKLKRVIYSTYQSVSGAGIAAMTKTLHQSEDLIKSIHQNHDAENLNLKFVNSEQHEYHSQRFAFNAIPKIGDFLENGQTSEEEKMEFETPKILGKKIKVHANCCRVPVFIGHSIFVNIETRENINLEILEEKLLKFSGIKYFSDKTDYLSPSECANKDEVFVSRLRTDKSVKNGLSFWCVSDNLRKGAALNSVQIAEHLIKIL